jgi:hypothetical protein
MKRKMTCLGMVALCAVALGLFLQKSRMVYTNHQTVVHDTIVHLLEGTEHTSKFHFYAKGEFVDCWQKARGQSADG